MFGLITFISMCLTVLSIIILGLYILVIVIYHISTLIKKRRK